MWFRIEAPHFVAGGETDESGNITVIAPICGWIRREKWSLDRLKEYCARRGWYLQIFGD